MTRRRTCDGCSRHVFASETQCPFCSVPLAPVRRVPNFKVDPRMSRAQRIALAGAIAGLIGCQNSDAHNAATSDGGAGTGGSANVDQSDTPPGTAGMAFYGAAVPPDGGRTTMTGTGGVAAPADIDAGDDDAGRA